MADLDARVDRLEKLLDRAVELARQSKRGRLILMMLGLDAE